MPQIVSLPAPTAHQLRQLAEDRLREAATLYTAGHFSAAWYMAGYVLELALKAVICRNLNLSEYPEAALGGRLKTHDVTDLILLAGLAVILETRRRESSFEQNWLQVTSWSPQDRYRSGRSQEQVAALLAAYNDAESGVLTWLSKQW